jgi:L-rhamnose mutarotase
MMQRMGMVIGIEPQMIAEYKRLHAAVWPDVLALISRANIRNYTIFLREPENLLFGTWEYHGTDFEADMAKIAADPKNQGMVVSHHPLPEATRQPQGRRVVGDDGRGLSSGLRISSIRLTARQNGMRTGNSRIRHDDQT